MYEDYEDLVERLRECIAEQNGEKTLWCQAADAIDNLIYICKHQAAELEELRKAVLRLEDESGIYDELPTFYIYPTKWIPVTERLPNFEGCLLCMRKEFVGGKLRYQDILYYDEDGFRMKFEDTPISTEVVTHWMPLPEPPKDGE